ncbi:Misexpression suppressor of ras [Culex quinquefasciatus]|uniref:Misexpression suppressor of ras n=1 Tax=Culex quinquefasciatus TaxID=7176 RepID=B0W1M9_CULQU|nr:Misexpression suppressor of ras [Culex quinquefasciatus]|eukprot:XP_001842613.1 Misexpression suppressor of ras [Culex quinquefasciatus]
MHVWQDITTVYVSTSLANLYESVGKEDWRLVYTGIPVLLHDKGCTRSRCTPRVSFVLAERGTCFALWKDTIDNLSDYKVAAAAFHTMCLSAVSQKPTCPRQFFGELAGVRFDPADLELSGRAEARSLSLLLVAAVCLHFTSSMKKAFQEEREHKANSKHKPDVAKQHMSRPMKLSKICSSNGCANWRKWHSVPCLGLLVDEIGRIEDVIKSRPIQPAKREVTVVLAYHRKVIGFSFDSNQAAREMWVRVEELISNPENIALSAPGRKRKSKKKPAKPIVLPPKSQISQPCQFHHVTSVTTGDTQRYFSLQAFVAPPVKHRAP